MAKKTKTVNKDYFVTTDEKEDMFRLYTKIADGQGFTGVAKAFGRGLSTVTKIAKDKKWAERMVKVSEKVAADSIKTVANDHKKRLKTADVIAQAATSQLFVSVDPSNPNETKVKLKIDPTISDAINANKYRDKLVEQFPEKADEHSSAMAPAQAEELLNILRAISKAGIEALGKFIVEKKIRLDAKQSES